MRSKVFINLAMVLLTGCGPRTLDVVANSSCRLPCWNGIVVGTTTRSELLGILPELDGASASSIVSIEEPWKFFDGTVRFSMGPPLSQWQIPGISPARVGGEVQIIDEKVVELILCGELGATFGEVLAQIGEPEGVMSIRNPFIGGIDVLAYNGQTGFEITFNTKHVPREIAGEISPRSSLDCISLFDPSIYAAMLEAKLISFSSYGAKETLEITYPWEGYGKIDELYPPRSTSTE